MSPHKLELSHTHTPPTTHAQTDLSSARSSGPTRRPASWLAKLQRPTTVLPVGALGRSTGRVRMALALCAHCSMHKGRSVVLVGTAFSSPGLELSMVVQT